MDQIRAALVRGDVPDVGAFMSRAYAYAQDGMLALMSCMDCADSYGTVTVNGESYEIMQVLGEGGFSIVYLVRDPGSGRTFALKKIRCQHGDESLRMALSEIESMRRFRGPHVLRLIDSAVVQDHEGTSGASSGRGNVPSQDLENPRMAKIVYLLLPYYKHGNVQDAIHAHIVHGTRFDERTMLTLFSGASEALRTMHQYKLPASNVTPSENVAKEDLLFEADTSDSASVYPRTESMSSAPELGSECVPYAHRDVKPANIMVADDGVSGVLMDFGSTMRARIKITSRRAAIAQQDLASVHTSMPYRAPELFDVKTDTTLDEKVDIWGLGCTLYAMAYLHSPFETPSTIEQGGSIALAVMNGAYKFPPPSDDPYSPVVRRLIETCLAHDPEKRPDIDSILHDVHDALASM